MRDDGDGRRVNIDVEPLDSPKESAGLLLISFHEQPNPSGESLYDARTRAEAAEPELLRQLEQELETTRDDLQGTIEEMESANEELKASNEEVMSMNEELQSANEELETSKEELQSLNEELSTVNSQLHDKVAEVESASNDMANLLNATHIATVFLDAALRIKLFTPAATRMFNLIATDVGRPIADLVTSFTDDDLLHEAQQLLHDLTPRDKEVPTNDGGWCIRRIMPYRTLDNRIDGVVITFMDITERKRPRTRSSGALPLSSKTPWTRYSARISTGPSEPGMAAPSGFTGTVVTRPWADRSRCSFQKTAPMNGPRSWPRWRAGRMSTN